MTISQFGSRTGQPDVIGVTLSPVTIRQGQAVVITYTDPTTGDDAAIQDIAGNDAASFTTGMNGVPAVTNNSTLAFTAPGAPASLTATASGSTTINLSWTAPADNGGSAVTGYKIEVSPDGTTNWTELVADTTATTYAHTGLAAGTTRHYRVSAINTNGTGLPSRTADATTGTTVPGAPDSLTATASGSTTIDLSWSAPDTTGGSAITGYKIEVSPDGTSNWTELVANTTSTDTTYAHTGLAAGTTRHYRVSAINSVGTGLPSDAANATTTDTVPNAAPIVANAIPDQSATAGTAFSYQVPANTFNDTDTGDTLSYMATKADGMALPTWLDFSAGTRTFAGTPATADVGTVAVKVTASDGNGGSVSDTFDIGVEADNTPPTLIGAEVFSAGASIGLRFSEVMATTRPQASAFTITADGSAVTISQFGSRTGQPDVIGVTLSPVTIRQGQAVVITYTDPTTGDDAQAIQDIAGNDAASFTTGMNGVPAVTNNSTLAPTVPGAPASLTATASGSTTINLSWTAPDTTGGSAITGYKIEVSPDGTTNWTELVADTAATTYAHTGLAGGTTRHYRVSAINSVGTGLPSSTANATTATTVPGAPDSLSATASGSTQIDLSWTAPADNGGSAVTGYQIEVSPDGTTNWTDLVADTAATTYAHTGLAAGTTRHYRVSAINSVGTGLPSSTANATTATTVPGAPDSLTATASGSTQIDLSWTAPADNGGSAVTGYQIEVSPDGTTNWTDLVADTAATTYAHTGLAAGTTRHYRVSAINSVGTGLPSSTADATTATTVPGAPDSLTATASGSTTIDLSWTAPADNGGSAVTGYRIEVSPDGTTNWTELVADTAATAYAHTGLAAGTTRHYRVSAINSVGTGLPSSTADATTATTVPGAPDSLTATASGSTTIDLSWTAPADNGGSAVTGYRIEVSPDGTTNWTELVADTAATAYAHTGLAAGTTRHYRVSAINSVGTGLPPPAPPTPPPPPPCPAPRTASRQRPAGAPRSTSRGPPRPTTAAPPSPATGSRSPPMAPPTGPSSSPTPPPPPTPTPGWPPAPPATTASRPSTRSAPASPPAPPTPPPARPPTTPRRWRTRFRTRRRSRGRRSAIRFRRTRSAIRTATRWPTRRPRPTIPCCPCGCPSMPIRGPSRACQRPRTRGRFR